MALRVFEEDFEAEEEEDEEEEEEEDEEAILLDEDEEEEDEEEGSGLTSWRARREEAANALTSSASSSPVEGKKAVRKTWEETFVDDPLRGDAPTRDFEQPADRFTRRFVVVALLKDNEEDSEGNEEDEAVVHALTARLRLRQQAWVHHMQWCRRSALLAPTLSSPSIPSSSFPAAAVEWEYTLLTADSMAPAGQVLCIQSNASSDALALLVSEPLQCVGAVKGWRLFEWSQSSSWSLRWDLSRPYLFLGLRASEDGQLSEEDIQRQADYHITVGGDETARRVSCFGGLKEVTTKDEGEGSSGVLMVLNALSTKDAQRYLAQDPLMKNDDNDEEMNRKKKKSAREGTVFTESVTLAPVNLQDVSGLHHIMPRTFSQKSNLESVHFMDPEDLLELELPTLPNLEQHHALNLAAIEALKTHNVSHRYTWFDTTERFGVEGGLELLSRRVNDGMVKMQRARLEPVQVVSDDGGGGSGLSSGSSFASSGDE